MSHIHVSIVVVNKLVFLKAMVGLKNSVGEASNNVAHKDRLDLDHNHISNFENKD